jgi:phosphotransferase system HPr (HPr) family protein
MRQETIRVKNEVGLHARPAALFVGLARSFDSSIMLRNATTGSDWVDGKSILSVLTLGVEKDHEIALSIDGLDEGEAADAILALIRDDFISS